MNNARVAVPPPRNEPILGYAPGSAEKSTREVERIELGACDPPFSSPPWLP